MGENALKPSETTSDKKKKKRKKSKKSKKKDKDKNNIAGNSSTRPVGLADKEGPEYKSLNPEFVESELCLFPVPAHFSL